MVSENTVKSCTLGISIVEPIKWWDEDSENQYVKDAPVLLLLYLWSVSAI